MNRHVIVRNRRISVVGPGNVFEEPAPEGKRR